MKSSNREEIVDHDAKGLFDIVLDIESYPYFIPWCSAMRIHSKNKNEIYADMVVWYKYFMPQTFGSHITFDKISIASGLFLKSGVKISIVQLGFNDLIESITLIKCSAPPSIRSSLSTLVITTCSKFNCLTDSAILMASP